MSTFSSSDHGRSTPHRSRRHGSFPHPRRTAPTGEEIADGGVRSLLISSLVALPCMAGVGMLLLLLAAGILLSVKDPDTVIPPLSIGILGISSLMGGIIAAKRCGHHFLLCGLTAGVGFAMLLWVLRLLLGPCDPSLSSGGSPWGQVALHAAVVVLSSAGGLMGGHRRPKTRHHKK